MDSELEKMKKNVLEDQMGFLCEELGDPGRYFPFFRSKKMLDSSDCQHIRSLSTFKDQIQELIERLKSRESNKGEGGFDVLVDALKKQRVQAHIARALQKALAKAKEEAVTTPSSGMVARRDALPGEEVASEPAAQCPTLISENNCRNTEQYQIHPQHGALPPLPTDQPVAISNVHEEQPDNIHPQHGLLPVPQYESNSQLQSGLATESSPCDSSLNGSEYELGGQSQPSSMFNNGSYVDSMSSQQPISYTTTTDSTASYTDSLDVLKLEARIRELTIQLERAQVENKKKDAQIFTMQKLLAKAGLADHDLGPTKTKAPNSLGPQFVRPSVSFV